MSDRDTDLSHNAASTSRLRALAERLTDEDLGRSLGGGWTVGFAFIHLAYWDIRQHFALQSVQRGDGFPSEDVTTNRVLESLTPTFRPETAAIEALRAAELLDATIANLSPNQHQALVAQGAAYAVQRQPHREEHLTQIEAVLP